jgi:hypothetical protein
MNEYTPDRWIVVKIYGGDLPLTYKVFACWYGGYLDPDSWKMNSGIAKVKKLKNKYIFYGFSGSVYRCFINEYGISSYGRTVLSNIIKRSQEEAGVTIEIMPQETNWIDLIK